MNWKEAFKEGEELVLATASQEGIPRAIVVISLGVVEDRLLIGICQMKNSFDNLKENNNVSLVAKKDKEYYMAIGKSEIYSSGKYFDEAIKRVGEDPYKPHHALVVNIKEVFDLDKGKKIF